VAAARPSSSTPHYGSPIYQVRATMGDGVHSGLPKVRQSENEFSSPPRVASTRRRRWRRALQSSDSHRDPTRLYLTTRLAASPRERRTPSGTGSRQESQWTPSPLHSHPPNLKCSYCTSTGCHTAEHCMSGSQPRASGIPGRPKLRNNRSCAEAKDGEIRELVRRSRRV
jgi:hypothetical protein